MANILPRLVSVFYGCTGVGCCLFSITVSYDLINGNRFRHHAFRILVKQNYYESPCGVSGMAKLKLSIT